jgi:YHS domain-containing protein
MKNRKTQLGIFFAVAVLLLVGLVALAGCKKKTETVETAKLEQKAGEVIEQKICPVMEAPIDKKYYTEYNGKKVYFCCPACKEQFEKEPGKYLLKLPQFGKELEM